MRISAAKTISVIGIAAVAALGAQYASAAPSHASHVSKASHPAVSPIRNIAYFYSTSTTGGTGDVDFSVPSPPNGVYAASFSANFFPEGSPAAPETFSCSLIKNGSIMRAQSTTTSTSDSGFYAGVNGTNTIRVATGDTFDLFCGTDDGSSWDWGTLPAQVTLTRLDGVVPKTLSETARKAGSLSMVASH